MNKQTAWYKQFWPWLLVFFPLLAIVGGVITAWLAIKSNDGLVSDDYYKQGLGINQTLARSEKAKELGLVAVVKLQSNQAELVFRPEPKDVSDILLFTLIHPTVSANDKTYRMVRKGESYRVELDPLFPGRWGVVIEDEQRTWRLNGTVHLPTETEVQISN